MTLELFVPEPGGLVSHFTDEEAEAQRKKVTCSRSHSKFLGLMERVVTPG